MTNELVAVGRHGVVVRLRGEWALAGRIHRIAWQLDHTGHLRLVHIRNERPDARYADARSIL